MGDVMQLYGSAPTRATRPLWMLEELGLEYDLVLHFDPASPEFLTLNPNGKVPVLVDDGFAVWESVAINLYLARRYGGVLWPDSLQDQTRATMWSFWAMTELEEFLLVSVRHRVALPDVERQPEWAALAEAEGRRPLGVLEGELSGRPYLLGSEFTVADLNVASILALRRIAGWDLQDFPEVERWEASCLARPAAIKVSRLPFMPRPEARR